MSELEDDFIAAVARQRLVRPSVRAVVLQADRILLQRPSDAPPRRRYAFIGGEYEFGDTFETRLSQEIAEETNARLVDCEYLFVVENRFVHAGHRIHSLEHYLLAMIDRNDVASRETHLVQEWLTLAELKTADVRPRAVRDVLAQGRQDAIRRLVIDGWASSAAPRNL